jgi:CHASE3 domain sensor protein
MSDQDELIAEAEIGDAARKFIESDLGKAMLDKADQQLRAAQEALETVEPTKIEEIRALQNKAQIARNFGEWIVELIDRGDNALTQWNQNAKS